MPVTIPPWLQPINPVPYFLQGVQQGENIAEKQNSAERAIQEMTLRREAQQRAREQQEAQMAMRQQQFALEQQASQAKARDAAMKYQWQRELGSRVEAGEDPMKAWVDTASKYAPERLPGAVLRQQDITQTAADRKAAANALAADRAARLALEREKFKAQPVRLSEADKSKQAEIFNDVKELTRERRQIQMKDYLGREDQKIIDLGNNAKNLRQAKIDLEALRSKMGSPSAQESGTVLPMPAKKSDLVKGQKYHTRHGVATWDGEQFVQ